MMHQELVERRRWISERRFFACTELLHIIARTESSAIGGLSRLADAAQLGWGGIIAGVLFILPSLSLINVVKLDLPAFRPDSGGAGVP
ncbi:MAG: hypothetical protein QX203_00970 [Methylococcaceae bacterium]